MDRFEMLRYETTSASLDTLVGNRETIRNLTVAALRLTAYDPETKSNVFKDDMANYLVGGKGLCGQGCIVDAALNYVKRFFDKTDKEADFVDLSSLANRGLRSAFEEMGKGERLYVAVLRDLDASRWHPSKVDVLRGCLDHNNPGNYVVVATTHEPENLPLDIRARFTYLAVDAPYAKEPTAHTPEEGSGRIKAPSGSKEVALAEIRRVLESSIDIHDLIAEIEQGLKDGTVKLREKGPYELAPDSIDEHKLPKEVGDRFSSRFRKILRRRQKNEL